MNIKTLAGSLILGLCLTTSCTTNPITGRSQIDLISSSQLMSASFQGYKETLNNSKLSSNQVQVNRIKTIGKRIQKAVEAYYSQKNMSDKLAGFEWEFNLIEDPSINAWCMPGGKVAFYTGILPICKTDEGIAVVMGHEIAHAVANHSGERATAGMVKEFGMGLAGAAVQNNPTTTNQILLQASGAVSELGVLKFSRTHESESDHMGLIFMAMAGYNPQEAPQFWGRMAAAGGQAPPEFLSTHPSSSTRIKQLNNWMSEAMQYYKP